MHDIWSTYKVVHSPHSQLQVWEVHIDLGYCMLLMGANQCIHQLSIHIKPRGRLVEALHRRCKQHDEQVPSFWMVYHGFCISIYANNGFSNGWPVNIKYIPNKSYMLSPCMETSSPSRCVLLLCLTVACGGSWLLEQPSSSVMDSYFRMEWMCEIMKATQLKLEIDRSSYCGIEFIYKTSTWKDM